ncbi:hypothetical protein KXW98_007327 [Aspergillus fumigatus]|uniref:BTB domain-containing protein n=1 Tax=Aspergillus fumigatus (strain ATCC MYA-4609 / CBS 101355 / FGSC A1100 / Af293) TaxID=330879 RepID=Q4WLE5_ASPFU|nr:hypothetical protein AFUA_6G13810 [Aspergillus fumigatus Af293]KAF4268098.1 hypothetical protein CNMCM8714_002207 [Aspergillus fumigatus]KMK63670.1 hypothetical protein Y699_04500 [Aspergillus fumigatus Z5]EAL89219.1 hypothetical protein AFUA_6G13810 [Aspergillus fumigatus Af293]KAF4269146.1 hypothetical protein CNMCM8812_001586 [Aspergillus fumigatus]KAF4278457.1 hypothetical protein CNMCM8057_000513 [Aspergillus fumigatus]
MEEENHIIDPDGEVIIIVHNPNARFAVWHDENAPAGESAEPQKLDGIAYEPMFPSDSHSDASNDEPVNGSVGKLARIPSEADVRIQVSAKHLMLASPVFKKALTGKWKEGSTFVGTGSVVITTEGWDVEAFLILLRILLCQHHKLPKRVSLELAAKIAVLADYYQCNDLVGFIRDAWITCLREELPVTYSRNLILWLWISWYFNMPLKFKKATSVAMSQSKDKIDALELPIPARIIYEMNQKRQQAICRIILQLQQERDAFMTGTKGCNFECRSIMLGSLTGQMYKKGLLESEVKFYYKGCNVQDLTKSVQSFVAPKWRPAAFNGPGGYAIHQCPHSSFSLPSGSGNTVEGLKLKQFLVN